MLSLEQIQRLENKVYMAVELIKTLKEENAQLKSSLVSANEKTEELEQFIADLRNSQSEIEETVIKALKQLDEIEKLSGANPELNSSQQHSQPGTAGKPPEKKEAPELETQEFDDVSGNGDDKSQLDIF